MKPETITALEQYRIDLRACQWVYFGKRGSAQTYIQCTPSALLEVIKGSEFQIAIPTGNIIEERGTSGMPLMIVLPDE